MNIPVVHGVIDRRILVNFRIDPDAMARVLPPPFEPKLVRSVAIGGVCLIRLKYIRPKFVRVPLGVSSEDAAHRMAVQWKEDGNSREGASYRTVLKR